VDAKIIPENESDTIKKTERNTAVKIPALLLNTMTFPPKFHY
jgi:hypothetical protein